LSVDCAAAREVVSEAGVRTVAHGFEPWEIQIVRILGSAL
jgi:hypothetical protein